MGEQTTLKIIFELLGWDSGLVVLIQIIKFMLEEIMTSSTPELVKITLRPEMEMTQLILASEMM